MSYKACENCGTKLFANGLCPNCHEEAVIMQEQSDDSPGFSRGFAEKAERQRREVRDRRVVEEG